MAGWLSLWPGALAQTPAPDFGAVYATPATGKSDRLAPGRPASNKADLLPVATPPSAPQPAHPAPTETLAAQPQPAPRAAAASSPGARQGASLAPADPGDGGGEILWSSGKSAAPPSGVSVDAPAHTASIPRGVELAIPMRDGSFFLGEIAARISAQNAVSLSKERLVQIATPLLRPDALDALKSVADSEGYLPLPVLREKGLDVSYDPGKVELQFTPGLEQRATGKLSAGRRREEVRSENIVKPASVAGYLNMRAGADYSSQPFLDAESTAGARIAFDGAARWSDVVFESAATFDMEEGFTRGGSRFVYDMPEAALRFSAGDVSPLKSDLQGGSELLGVSIEKSYRKLQPGANIRPTGSRSFRIERPSSVDVVVNGHVMQRLHLRAGDYNLDDLPLTAGANDISLVIVDDVGQKRTLDFTVFSGRSLLAPGVSEWALSAGVASHYGADRLPGLYNAYGAQDYDFSTPVVSGVYERGLTPDITGNVHLQAAPDVAMGGVGVAMQTAFGFWLGDLAASGADGALGNAAGIGYELSNVQGEDGVVRSLRLTADYRSERFAAIGLTDRENEAMLDISAVYSQPLAWDVSASIGGTYAVGRGDTADRYGVELSLSRSFGGAVSAGLSAGYEQALGDIRAGEPEDGFTATLRLSYRVDDRSSIDAGHELSGGGRSHVAYRHNQGAGVGSWNAQIELDRSGALAGTGRADAGDYGVTGSLGYIANRAELAVSQYSGLAGLDTNRLDQRSSITAGTALAFADGRFAVGRPVANGFAIIDAHDRLSGSEVAIGGAGDARQGTSGPLGPALVSDISPYAPARVAYDVDKLPVGYDLGAGAFDLYPAYRSGYRLTVGSDYTVTAYGTLVDESGEPVALLTGAAVEEGGDPTRRIAVFTNRTGRFGAQGLRPGRWLLDMDGEPGLRFLLEVPKGAVGLVKLETLQPVGRAP
jgi:outer membrane usher protein